jgi:DNA-binding response OmpR family regulator
VLGGVSQVAIEGLPRVLVCDADRVSLRHLASVLSNAGFAVATCGSAAECEAALAADTQAVLVLAILLPDLDGLALTRRLRAAGQTIPILIVSALLAERRALDAGADAFLPKPVASAAFLAACSGLVPPEVSS